MLFSPLGDVELIEFAGMSPIDVKNFTISLPRYSITWGGLLTAKSEKNSQP
jgi:hypothetical protein